MEGICDCCVLCVVQVFRAPGKADCVLLDMQGVLSVIAVFSVMCRCSEHQEKLTVYCWTCKECICHQCALWGGTVSTPSTQALYTHFYMYSSLRTCRRTHTHLHTHTPTPTYAQHTYTPTPTHAQTHTLTLSLSLSNSLSLSLTYSLFSVPLSLFIVACFSDLSLILTLSFSSPN